MRWESVYRSAENNAFDVGMKCVTLGLLVKLSPYIEVRPLLD